mgnify:CR=1 FL=1
MYRNIYAKEETRSTEVKSEQTVITKVEKI